MLRKSLTFAATTALLVSAYGLQADSAQAATFNFSYAFSSGETLSGQIEGDLADDKDSVLNLRNLKAAYSGLPGTSFSFLTPFKFSHFSLSGRGLNFLGFNLSPKTDSINPNMGFSLRDEFFLNSATLGLFQTNSTTVYYSNRENSEEFEVFSRDRWNAAEAKDVPESSAIAGLALLAVGGCLLKRKAACS
ncbi:PEP-CTERM sorting domain-containing protein [Geitlerinema sp. PCC 7407]|uniref:PEP-CTERM sorting domain-containing protein n=1 Tax=Geitlerinema sp. PCC 7407 TaxID=1173025 RepID=UPI00029FC28A|nr:PEP-CTERM sorting domain-containing protein [Geitlerinema sp. PCC 7407]AFY65847.1 hypothetical protein GEI7407_1353 [Geitlerinema sp. PCC 7407]